MSINTFKLSDDFIVVTVIGMYVRVDKVFNSSSIEDVVNRIINEDDIDNVIQSIMDDKSLIDDYVSQYLVGNPIVVEGDNSSFDMMLISVID